MSARIKKHPTLLVSVVLLSACVQQVDDGNQTAQGQAELSDPDDAGPSTEGAAAPTVTAPAESLPIPFETNASADAQKPAPPSACPPDMVEVKGDFCPTVLQECLRWVDKDHTNKLGVVDPNMCAEFRYPSLCTSPKLVPMHFCVDRYEWPNIPGEVPATRMSWVEARSNCESLGKRLCTDHEWTFACEGPNMKPYPYGDGYHRDSSACNIDRRPWIDPWTHPFEEVDKRVASASHEACHSDWGVYDMTGNVDEWVVNTRGNAHREPWISGLMGGHWVYGVRNRCRAITESHEPTFTFYVTGARCCADAASTGG